MPYTTSYVDDGKGVFKTGSGIVTGLEIFSSALQESSNEARSRKLRYGLVDFSDVEEMKVTPEDIRRIVEMNRKLAAFTPGALVAIVAPTELPYALARLWHTFSDDLGWKANVFHARADAIAWLRKELLAKEGPSDALDQFPSLQPAS
ncbi:MAG TPA: hypothetical protein VGZ93_05030 [Candidatus Methylacidiphilales bacterium]|jgi:hypothetical protein|nr:hypothetical protein [Candidatus Methylacidiphilales bacterium]